MPDNVAIFWDYENCALPALEPSYMIVNKIRRLAHQYGSVKTFKAYVEYPEHQTVKSMALRSELQSCGVSLIDCPHNGRKDVADKMIMVDMMAYAIDNPAPATIILISGDRDFVYAVSILALRQYRVVLLAPRVAYSNLRAQANVVYNWPEDFFPELPPSKLSNPRGQRSSDSADDSHLQKSSNNGSYAPRYSKVAAKLPDRSYVPSDIRVDSTPLATNWALHDDREDQIPEWQGSPNPEEWLDEPDNTEEESETQPQDSPVGIDSSEEKKADRESQSPSFPISWGATAESGPLYWGTPSNASVAGDSRTPPLAGDVPCPDRDEPRHTGLSWANHFKFVHARALDSTSKPVSFFGADDGADEVEVVVEEVEEVVEEVEEKVEEWHTYTRAAKKPPQVPAEFKPLVKVLKRQLAQGVVMLESSMLGSLLSQEVARLNTIYERAGVTKLKEYTALAAERGVVAKTNDSGDGHNYITLHPAYRRTAQGA